MQDFRTPGWALVGIATSGLVADLTLQPGTGTWILWLSLTAFLCGMSALLISRAQSRRACWLSRDRVRRSVLHKQSDIKTGWIVEDVQIRQALTYVSEVVGDLEPEPPRGLPPRQTLRQNLTRNSQLAWGVFQPGRRHEGKLVGLLIAYPLTKAAVAHLDNERIYGSSQILPEHVSTVRGRPAGYYLSFVGGRTTSAQALVMLEATRRFRDQDLWLFTRPITPDGRRAASRYGFAPMPASPVWKRALVRSNVVASEHDAMGS